MSGSKEDLYALESFETYSAARSRLLDKFGAYSLESHPYHNQAWLVDAKESSGAAECLKGSVRLYYLSKYWVPS